MTMQEARDSLLRMGWMLDHVWHIGRCYWQARALRKAHEAVLTEDRTRAKVLDRLVGMARERYRRELADLNREDREHDPERANR